MCCGGNFLDRKKSVDEGDNFSGGAKTVEEKNMIRTDPQVLEVVRQGLRSRWFVCCIRPFEEKRSKTDCWLGTHTLTRLLSVSLQYFQ